ncbi:hypothetical protein [Clostridium perfringens]|uniref:hypothetical protein n=1 Tax=Clostridium perfringens TaxID=1502 RepID=UPI002245BCD0|nr:hypothetical protein [Clostridium perfringens]MCX0367873.1 hypothetical protein [Clostridium perfringens]
MIHTLEITHKILSSKHFDEIYKSITFIGNSKLRKVKEGCYVTNSLREWGFTQIQLISKKVDKKYKYNIMQMKIILNPKRLIDSKSNSIMLNIDKERVIEVFNRRIKIIHNTLPLLEHWTTNRVDYALDIFTGDVEKYILLFQRGDKPKAFNELYCNKSKTRKQRKGSFYLFSESVNINFYNKEDESMKKNGDVERIRGILRLEVQCKKVRTNYIKKKNKFESKQLKYYFIEHESQKQIKEYYRKTVGVGDYYKLEKAIELVNKSNYSNSIKSKLIKTLKLVSKHRSIWKARNNRSCSEKSFNKYLRLLRKMNINPVTIPIRWETEKLPNILNC